MQDQLTFEGFEPAPGPYRRPRLPKVARPRHGLFLALLPGEDLPPVEAAAAALRQAHGTPNGVVAAGRLHITSADLGSFAEPPTASLVGQVRRALAGLALPVVDIRFDTVMRFKGNGALVLREAAAQTPLTAFRDALAAQLDQARLAFDPGGVPHMTLGYGGEPFSAPLAAPLCWVARELVLIHTLIGRGEHHHLARWPLQPAR